MRNRIKEDIKVSLDTPLIFAVKAIVPGAKTLVLFGPVVLGRCLTYQAAIPAWSNPPSSISLFFFSHIQLPPI